MKRHQPTNNISELESILERLQINVSSLFDEIQNVEAVVDDLEYTIRQLKADVEEGET